MQRDIEKDLLKWKGETSLMPLLVRGARQVGKSYVVEKFGREHFKNCLVINFEQYPEFKKAFQTLDTKKIIQTLELLTGLEIIPGQSLLFWMRYKSVRKLLWL